MCCFAAARISFVQPPRWLFAISHSDNSVQFCYGNVLRFLQFEKDFGNHGESATLAKNKRPRLKIIKNVLEMFRVADSPELSFYFS